MPGDIIILHLSTTKDNHMMYGSWAIMCNRECLWGTTQNFFLTFTDKLEKQIFIKKTVEVGQ